MNLEIRRTSLMYQNESKTLVGDVIQFDLKTGETVQAMKMTDGGIWCFVDCLKEEHKMKGMKKHLEGILEQFPDEIRQIMKPFEDGRLLRLPTEKEVFGENTFGDPEPEEVTQWEPMKLRRNRIAFQGLNGDWEWWWTETKHRDSASYFAYVLSNGSCDYNLASYSFGVRPAFRF